MALSNDFHVCRNDIRLFTLCYYKHFLHLPLKHCVAIEGNTLPEHCLVIAYLGSLHKAYCLFFKIFFLFIPFIRSEKLLKNLAIVVRLLKFCLLTNPLCYQFDRRLIGLKVRVPPPKKKKKKKSIELQKSAYLCFGQQVMYMHLLNKM